MKKAVMLLGLSLLFSGNAIAGAKDDFKSAVVKECGKSEADADALATGGRQGNVMKWKTCTSSTVTVQKDAISCTLTCTDSSSKIGG